jgi:hypothetical protein
MSATSTKALRKKSSAWVAIAIFCGSQLLAPVQAANIYWQTPTTMTSDTDVRNFGSLVGAYTLASYDNSTTVNGVSFTSTVVVGGAPSAAFGSLATLAPVGGSSFNVYGLGEGEVGTPATPPLSTAYGKIANGGGYAYKSDFSPAGAAPMTLTLNNLTPGKSYMIQTWVNESRGSQGSRKETLTGGFTTSGTLAFNSTGADGGNGSFVMGNFVADSTSQVVNFNIVNSITQMNAFQLRDVTATVNWSAVQKMTAATDVRTDGTLVGAYTAGGANNATTVNGVPFSWVNISGGLSDTSATFGSVATAVPLATSGTSWALYGLGVGETGTPADPALSADYAKLAQGGIIGAVSPDFSAVGGIALTLTNLTPGQQYLFQTWVNDSRGSVGDRTQTLSADGFASGVMAFNSTGANGGNGSFVVGDFVATGDSMTISYIPGVGGVGQMNAFQLRAVAVPEPSALALAGLGVAAAAWACRRRK